MRASTRSVLATELLVPLSRKRLVKRLPLAIEPDRAAGEAFLSQGIDRNDVVPPGCLPGLGIGKRQLLLRLLVQADNCVFAVATIHPIDAIALNSFFVIGLPFKLARRSFLLGK